MAVDEGVAQIVEALRRNGQLDNTLIVFLSDNGFMHGEHRALAEKVLPYEESIRVPLVLRGPGVPRGPNRPPARGERGRDLHDPRRGRRGARPRAGRPLAARAARRPRRRVGPRHPDRERQRRQRRAHLPRHPQLPLPVRGAQDHRRDASSTTWRTTRSSCRASTGTPRTRSVQRDLHTRLRSAGALRGRGLPGPAPPDALGAIRRPPRDRLLHEGPARPGARLEARPAAARRRDDRPPPRGAPAQHPDRTRPAQRPRDPERDREAPADPPHRGRFRLRVLAETEDGRRLTLDRTLRRCP